MMPWTYMYMPKHEVMSVSDAYGRGKLSYRKLWLLYFTRPRHYIPQTIGNKFAFWNIAPQTNENMD